jgi:hypothetical protein
VVYYFGNPRLPIVLSYERGWLYSSAQRGEAVEGLNKAQASTAYRTMWVYYSRPERIIA